MNDNPYEEFYCAQQAVYNYLGRHLAAEQGASHAQGGSAGIIYTLEHFTPVIMPGEVIVGFNFSDLKYNYFFYHQWPYCCIPQDTPEERALLKKNNISDTDIESYYKYLKNPIPFDVISTPLSQRQQYATMEWASSGNCCDTNHSVIGYKQVLKLGFSGLLEQVKKYEAQNGTNTLYSSMKQICIAACEMGKKYVALATQIKQSGDDRYRNEDLDQIISICSRVPHNPATTFKEAVQALWFAHILNTWEDWINANSLGRLDQILYPYYKADIEKGILTKEEAFEVICMLWIKLYRNYDVQQSCVGGTAPDGSSQVNDLSYLMLDATEKLDFIRCLSVRFSQNTEKEFIKRALEVVSHVGKGVPFFFNDDVMIPAIESKGIPHEHACDYTQIGCVETVIPGKSNPHAVTGNVNVLKALELVFGNGYSIMFPDHLIGPELGALNKLTTFDKLLDAVKKQMHHLIDMSCDTVKKARDNSAHNSPKPVKSLLTQGCMETGRDYNDAGALYDYYQIMLGGVPNLADSLEVIRTFVYDQKKYTLEQIRDILINDFPDESVRLEFINKAAKFGNNIDSVDSLASDIISFACDCLDEFSEKYGISFHAQPFTYLWMIEEGQFSAASPDGRRRGEVPAYSPSPMQGRDFNGLTALLNSISKMPTKRTPGTTSAIVEVDPKLFTDSNISLLADILMTAADMGLENVQFNTVDASTLEDAKKNPEKHNNLAVRVSGFSSKFVHLNPLLQDHIIARTKHTCT